ncbi:hypothetical protein KS419_22865 [Bacillus tamaricis]|uniref:Uncharacterized protein n=1 Tax=Evansella tamaricis TaxID=2069301 RepID=A0ABS6JQD0_9BACI|nr:hypothetical protein [Evansella tamaricis]
MERKVVINCPNHGQVRTIEEGIDTELSEPSPRLDK